MRSLAITTFFAFVALAAFPAPSAAGGSWSWPVAGEVITPYRNGTDPYAAGQHRGIDIAAERGSAVRAASAGLVTFAGLAGSSGVTVAVRTSDGRYDLSYLHLDELAVREDERVAAGDRIGSVGTSGRRSADEPHLHFGVREAHSRHAYRNPLDFLAPVRAPQPAPEPRPVPVALPELPLLPQPQPLPSGEPRGVVPSPLPAAAAPSFAGAGLPAPQLAGAAELRDAQRASPSAGAQPGPAPESRADPSAAAAPGRPRELAASGPGANAGTSARPDAAARPVPAPRRERGGGGGLNLGWLAACCGIVAVALALGRPAGPAAALRQGRAAITALTRPLAGRG